MDSILCYLGYLMLDLLTGRYRADDADFFSCVSRISRLHSRRGDTAGRRRESGDFGRRFLSEERWIAEPNHCRQRGMAVSVPLRGSRHWSRVPILGC
jgi:hypothetical protein